MFIIYIFYFVENFKVKLIENCFGELYNIYDSGIQNVNENILYFLWIF